MGPKVDPTRIKAPQLTHFLCIPLKIQVLTSDGVTTSSRPQLLKSLTTFKEDVTKSKTEELPDGVPERAVRPVGTLHLTLGVMSLLTEEKVDGVLKLLKDIDFKELLGASSPAESVVKDSEDEQQKGKEAEVASEVEPLKITLKGLRSMQSASKTSVLYSSPLDPDLRLNNFCKSIQQLFVQAGFIAEQKKKLLLHATILNTIYAKGVKKGGTVHGKKGKAKLLFNAGEILDRYRDCLWMENVTVEKVTICRMGAKVGEDGEEKYEVEGDVVISELWLLYGRG